jgi:lipopolysaccharide transport system ATP-binding protein
MSDAIVSVEHLGKRYQLGHRRDPYGRLTETLADSIRAPLARIRGARQTTPEWLWALRDVSFELHAGTVLGLIGRNGAGKTTLLKILSRITEPTEGRATVRGRSGSLLEVGTGFHPELTGRENVYMSGAVLGLRRAEIDRKFDEIVQFAGVEAFLDTPVKRYSTGMQVRLGFAVAAHLEPEVLFVDEVLAVGDAAFQAKCLGRISEIGASGRTVVFVSHSMQAVTRLCSRAILLDRGIPIADGPPASVVQTYLESSLGRTDLRLWNSIAEAPGDDVAKLRSVRLLTRSGASHDELPIQDPIEIEVRYSTEDARGLSPSVNLHFFNEDGICLFVTNDWNDREWRDTPRQPGVVRAVCTIPGNFLAEGRVVVTVAVSTYDPTVVHVLERDAIAFQVVDRTTGSGVRGPYPNDWPGVVRPMLDWHVEPVAPDYAS